MNIAIFTFNPFQENTYLLYDETSKCMIIDPGCMDAAEQKTLVDFIEGKQLKPTILFNTHCHIDHVLGNAFVAQKYDLELTSHPEEKQVLDMQPTVSGMYGIPYSPSPPITQFVGDGDRVAFGNTTLSVLFTPGHSPASVSLYHVESKTLIAGDVLFQGSIGRTDLPGGNFDTLISSIKTKFYSLPDDTIVYPGHGPSTNMAFEKANNPFLQS